MIGNSEGPPDGDARKIVELDLKYETMRELQNELAPLLSNDGLFIPGDQPVDPDSVVRFRVMLPDEFTLIEGTGVVVWTRRVGDEKGPPGVAVRYASLPRETQETIDAMIDAHLASGGELFNLEPGALSSESFPTDALDYRSLDGLGTNRRGSVSAADALSELERASLAIRGETEAVSPPPDSGEEGTGVSLEDDSRHSVEAQVQEVIASVRDRVTQMTEPVDPVLVELTTDVDEPAAEIETEPHEPRPESEAESVIPEFLDRWRQEVETEPVSGGTTERLDFEPGVDDVVTDAMPVGDPADTHDKAVLAARDTEEPRSGARPWWLVPLVAVIAVVVVGSVVWLWSLGGDAPEPVPQVVDRVAQPSDEAVGVTVVQQPESEVEPDVATETERAALPMPQPSLEPATVVVSIVWRSGADGTEVEIRGNGTIPESTVETFGLSEPPRVLVRLRQIQEEYGAYELPVGTPEIERIRVGHHPELTPPALYVVLDLARPDVRVTDVSVEGDTARVTVR